MSVFLRSRKWGPEKWSTCCMPVTGKWEKTGRTWISDDKNHFPLWSSFYNPNSIICWCDSTYSMGNRRASGTRIAKRTKDLFSKSFKFWVKKQRTGGKSNAWVTIPSMARLIHAYIRLWWLRTLKLSLEHTTEDLLRPGNRKPRFMLYLRREVEYLEERNRIFFFFKKHQPSYVLFSSSLLL